MPELPELEALRETLDAQLSGLRPTRATLRQVALLKTFAPPLDAIVGAPWLSFGRCGKHLVLKSGAGVSLVIHLGIGGRLLVGQGRTPPRAVSLELAHENGPLLRVVELGTKKRSSTHVVETASLSEHLSFLGPDALDNALTADRLGAILRGERSQLKHALTDQRRVAGIGNAYSDEILWAACLAPLRLTSTLEDDEVERLWQAMRGVLGAALERAREDNYLLEARGDERGAFQVHRREREPCPRCGIPIASVHYAESSLQYCPACQVDGRAYADRRLSRLLR